MLVSLLLLLSVSLLSLSFCSILIQFTLASIICKTTALSLDCSRTCGVKKHNSKEVNALLRRFPSKNMSMEDRRLLFASEESMLSIEFKRSRFVNDDAEVGDAFAEEGDEADVVV